MFRSRLLFKKNTNFTIKWLGNFGDYEYEVSRELLLKWMQTYSKIFKSTLMSS